MASLLGLTIGVSLLDSMGSFASNALGLSGATTMNMINRTSKTSISGVTFIFGGDIGFPPST
jgi:hypothetical protein